MQEGWRDHGRGMLLRLEVSVLRSGSELETGGKRESASFGTGKESVGEVARSHMAGFPCLPLASANSCSEQRHQTVALVPGPRREEVESRVKDVKDLLAAEAVELCLHCADPDAHLGISVAFAWT
ncbi:hypothetical protein EYF80_024326 [Liparis tanakae]|uniref:Uncharacterized protein n=1 Tax=Liparis tanakae TaxID=230148 RepID=A0A4Z2HI42_9TELE|nr:hypothetical protein EYF80_024326 [Liparis tanakae]